MSIQLSSEAEALIQELIERGDYFDRLKRRSEEIVRLGRPVKDEVIP